MVNLNLVLIIEFVLVVFFELFDCWAVVGLLKRKLAGNLTSDDVSIYGATKTLVIKLFDFIIALISIHIKIKCTFFLKVNSAIVILMSPSQICLCIIVSNMVDRSNHICLEVPARQIWERDIQINHDHRMLVWIRWYSRVLRENWNVKRLNFVEKKDSDSLQNKVKTVYLPLYNRLRSDLPWKLA